MTNLPEHDPLPSPPPPGDRKLSETPSGSGGSEPSPDISGATPVPAANEGAEGPATLEEKIVASIKEVYDPEIPVNIYELGLIYKINIAEDKHVVVDMTLTSPACPAAQELPVAVRRSVERVPAVNGVEVEITFDPPWTPEMMSEEAKLLLGFM